MPSNARAGGSRLRTAGAAAFLATLVALVVIAAPGSAAPVGNLESWGTYGVGQGQYANATMFGVDPGDGSVYVGDMTEKVGGSEGVRESFRIQKFSSNGTFQGSVLIPRFYDPPTNNEFATLFGVAIDPTLHRLYLLQGGQDPTTSETYGRRILVYSTTPEGTKLVAPAGGPSSIALPTEGSERILNPTSIAVDPKNHEIEVLGENFEPTVPVLTRPLVIQRVTSTGSVGPRFTDTAKKLSPALEQTKMITVGPSGTTYALTGRNTKGKNTRAWELPENLSEVKEVGGFAAAAASEEWSFGLEQQPAATTTGGAAIAISPDGETLYWKELIEKWSPPSSGGNYLIHGFSLKSKATTVAYGGATSSPCRISSADAMFGVTGEGTTEKLVLLDPGQLNEEEQQAPAFGGKVLTFGRGGSGCPVASAKFKVNGVEEGAEVGKGTTVTFDASGSELTSGPTATKGFVKEAIWKFGDGFEQTVTSSGSTEAPLTTTHVYASGGNFTATLQIRFKKPSYGNPLLVEHKVLVSGGTEEFGLKASKEGSGTLTSSPGGIDCGSTCEAKFAKGTQVKVTGTPEAGFKAPTWTGCDAVAAGACEVTMEAAKNVKATFVHEQVQLTVNKEGTGSGTVTSSTGPIDCGATCNAQYEFEAEVTLTAVSDPGTAPVLWTGCDSEPSATQCKVKMSAARNVTATFSPVGVAALAVEKKGTGTGTVTSAPAGIDCGATCSAQYEVGKLVKLTATPGAGSKAATWTGCDAVAAGVCEVAVNSSRTVTATFEVELRLLKVKTEGTGSGSVSSLPGGINCGVTCEASFGAGTLVKLTGAPTAGSKAATWTGCDAVTSGVCEVTMNVAKEVKATFDPEPAPPGPRTLTVVEPVGSAGGTVTSAPGGISCHESGGSCSSSFAEGTAVTLTAVADPKFEPVVWSDCDSEPGPGECKVTMSAAKTVTAAFEPTRRQLTVERSGSGSGAVTSEPAGIDCGGTCTFGFAENTLVKLTANPDPGSGAARWSGCDTVTSTDQCEVRVTAAKKVIAGFSLQGRLTVTKLGSARGSVSSSPAGISCGGTCQAGFGIGETVTLTAFAAPGARSATWSGCDAVTSSNLCVVLVGAATSVTATFEPTGSTTTPSGSPPAEETVSKKKKSKLQEALAKCTALKGKAKQQRCERQAKAKFGAGAKKSKQAKKQKKRARHAKNGGHG